MRKIKNTYQAFTLIELLIATAISLLAIAMAYTAFSFISFRFVQQKNTTGMLVDVYRLQSIINYDYNLSHMVGVSDSTIKLIGLNRQVTYHIDKHKNYIVRQNELQVDSFSIASDGIIKEASGNSLSIKLGVHRIPLAIDKEKSVVQLVRSRYEN